jgi:hypothetical protein
LAQAVTILSDLQREPGGRHVQGQCAKCYGVVWESLWILDDAFNAYAGRCPHCGAINLLSMDKTLRGYDMNHVWLVLPTDEEAEANKLHEAAQRRGLPRAPTRGPGGPVEPIGTLAGAIARRLMEGNK